MAINFPNNPQINDTHTDGTSTWRWNGYAWIRVPDPGDKGEKGESGGKGEKGTTGQKGNIGDKGEQGGIGPEGVKGDKGDKGETGAGTKGEKGENGADGGSGADGDKGDAGVKGDKGTKGESGTGGTTLLSDAQENTVGGTDAGLNLDSDTFRNTFFGYQAGEQVNSGDDNTFIGHMAGDACTSGYKNVGVGAEVLPNLSSGYQNVAVGWEAGRSMGSGYRNVAIGDMAGRTFTSAVECIAIGYHAASNFGSGSRVIGIGAESVWLGGTDLIGIGNFTMARGGSQVGGIGIGYRAGRNNKGDHNIYLGYQSGFGRNSSPYSTGEYNIAFGYRSLYNVDTSFNNIAIGSSTANTLTTGSNNIIIGSGVDVPSASTSNQIIIGDSNITKFSIPGINVVLKDNNGTPTQGHVLTVDANGEASFAAASGGGGGGSTDKIEEGNTKAEVVDTGTEGHFLVETEGIERLRITSTGDVGIGTDNPSSILHLKQTSDAVYMTFDTNSNVPFWVGSTGTTQGFFIEQASTNNSILTSDVNDYVSLYGAGTKRFETKNDGAKVSGDLHISSSSSEPLLVQSSGADSSIRFQNSVGSSGYIGYLEEQELYLWANGQERVRITSTGDVGIGTTVPTDPVTSSNTSILAVGIVTANKYYGDGSNLTGVGSSTGSVPVGSIVVWSGSVASIPSDYQLCDGSTPVTSQLQTLLGSGVNVPDLRDRFIIGANDVAAESAYPGVGIGSTGGSADAVVVEHKHTTSFDGKKYFPGGGSTTIGYGGAGGYPADVFSMNNEGESGTNKNLPPYYALCYIIKHTATGGDVGVSRVAILKDQKNQGVPGGNFTAFGWRDRDLTVEEDPSNFVDFTAGGSQSSGSAGNTPGYWSLPAGTYKIEWSCPGNDVSRHKTRLVYSTTESQISTAGLDASALFVEGSSENTSSSSTVSNDTPDSSNSIGYTIITLTETTWFKILHYCTTTDSTYGFGHQVRGGGITTLGPEIYSQVRIEDLATVTKSGVTIGDKIEEGDTKAEVIDTGTDGRFVVTTEGVERLRITSSGLVSIKSTGQLINESGLSVRSAGNTCVFKAEGNINHNPLICWNNSGSGNRSQIAFGDGTTFTSHGTIYTNGSTVTYGGQSDYRLKQDEVLITDGIEKVKLLKPRRFKWKNNLNLGICDGFFAHEIEEAIPTSQASIGTKDAVATESDVNVGLATSIGDPIYQQVDQSKLIPILTAALKEAIAKIETLEAKVAALEGS